MSPSQPPDLDPDDFRVALSNCEREPIHVPGQVQPFGALLAIDVADERLTHHSSNLAEVLGLDDGGLGPDVRLAALLGDEAAHAVRGIAALDTLAVQRERLGRVRIGAGWQDLAACRVDTPSGPRLVIECEPAAPEVRSGSLLSRARHMLATTCSADGVQPLLERAVACVRDTTGHDRVMAYRFFDNGDGEVVAEATGVGIDSFLGLRYPGYDIPPQVRRIALRCPLRLIADIGAAPAGLLDVRAQGGRGEPLDLSLAHLRGISPIHIEYLANMGVRSTLSLSLTVRGELWGLISCHHHRPNRPSADDRALCELFTQFLSLELQQRIEEELLQSRRRADSVYRSLMVQPGQGEPLAGLFGTLVAVLPTLVAHDGLALLERDRVMSSGNMLPEALLRQLVALADPSLDIVTFESLVALAECGDAWRDAIESGVPMLGGALVLRLVGESDLWLVLLRNEIMTEVRWGGIPDKSMTYGPNGPRLHPRGSFDEYRQSVRGRCAPWSVADQAVLTQLRLRLFEVVLQLRAVSDIERDRQRRQGELLIAELNHRVKNILALVQSITRQTRDDCLSVDQYADALERRITALATMHDTVGANGLQWADLETMLLRGLRPFGHDDEQRIVIDGDACRLRGDIAPILGLVFHEMATNSAKHGALSTSGGRLGVVWTSDAGGLLIAWRESGGPRVTPPVRSGFGRSLIEGAIAYECEGEARMRFLPTGLEVDLWLPAASVSFESGAETAGAGDTLSDMPVPDAPSDHAGSTLPAPSVSPPPGVSSGARVRRALVVEDNLLIVNDARHMLVALGYRDVDAAPSVRRALELLRDNYYDLALVDINLRDESGFGAAAALRGRGIPIVFCTGYDIATALSEPFIGTPILGKPLTLEALSLVLDAGGTVPGHPPGTGRERA